jgi:hypothetical protein
MRRTAHHIGGFTSFLQPQHVRDFTTLQSSEQKTTMMRAATVFMVLSWIFIHINTNFIQLQQLYEGVFKSFRTESITKYRLTTINTHWEATQRVMVAKLTRLTHKIAIQLHLVVESCNICSSRSRRPVRKLLVTPSYFAKRCSLTSVQRCLCGCTKRKDLFIKRSFSVAYFVQKTHNKCPNDYILCYTLMRKAISKEFLRGMYKYKTNITK